MFITMEEVNSVHKKLINKEIDIESLDHICAISDTKEDFVLIRNCRIDREENEILSNFFPNQEGIGNNFISCIIWDFDEWTTAYPIPDSFNVISAKFEGNKLFLESDGGRNICLIKSQLANKLSFINEITITELEQRFFECRNIPENKPQKTKKAKKYINISSIGKLFYNADEERFEFQHNNIVFGIEDIATTSKMKEAKIILKQLFENKENYFTLAKKYTAKELLTVKNEIWSNKLELSEDDFVDRLNLISVNVQDDGIIFEFEDNDLFFGHCIETKFDLNLSPVSSAIIG